MEYFNLKHVANKMKNQISLQPNHTTSIFKGINSKNDGAEMSTAENVIDESSKSETVSNFRPDKDSGKFRNSQKLSLKNFRIQGETPETSLSPSCGGKPPTKEDFDKTEKLMQAHQDVGKTKGERLALKEYLHRELRQLYPDSSEKRRYLENRLRELDEYDDYMGEGINTAKLLNLSEIDEKVKRGVIIPILSSTPKLLTSDLMNRFTFVFHLMLMISIPRIVMILLLVRILT